MTATQRRTRKWLDEQRRERESVRERAGQIVREAQRVLIPSVELAQREPEPRADLLERVGLNLDAIKYGPQTWAMFRVEQRLMECGIIGNRNRWTGKCLDYWAVDKEQRAVYAMTPDDEQELSYESRHQQTMMVAYLIGSLIVDEPRGFAGVKVEVYDGHIRLRTDEEAKS